MQSIATVSTQFHIVAQLKTTVTEAHALQGDTAVALS